MAGLIVSFIGNTAIPGRSVPPWLPYMVAATAAVQLALFATLGAAIFLSERLPKKSSLALIVAATLMAAFADAFAASKLLMWFNGQTAGLGNRIINNLQLSVWFFGFLAVAIKLLRNARISQQQLAHLANVKRNADEARLAALRRQISPHFLFNSLNALSSLIIAGRSQEAKSVMVHMRTFLVDHLATSRDVVSLDEELEAIEAYLGVEMVRFADRLSVEIDCDAAARRAEVPTLLLQPLVENVIKHAVAPSTHKIRIHITARKRGNDLRIEVSNDMADVGSQPGLGVGLKNVRERLLLTYGEDASLNYGAGPRRYCAEITIPFQSKLLSGAGSNG